MHPDGRAARMLHADSRSSDEAPAWSHDGTRVAFVAHGGNRATIEVMSADGAHARRLTNSRLVAWNPIWLPHDAGIAFLASDTGYSNGNLFVMRPDGRHVHQITHWHGSAQTEQFAWVGARYRYGRC